MSTFRNPVGPQPSSVYWRRRLVVGLAALAVVVIVLLLLFQPRNGSTEPAVSGTSPSPSVETSQPPADPSAACAPGTVSVEASTDKNSYASNEEPLLTLTLTNDGAVPCTFNAGSTQQEFLITSGSELYWNSKDCQSDPVDAPVVLEPNVPQSTNPLAWNRTRSSTDTCEGDRPKVPAGGATYHLNINVGELKSNDVPFILN